MSNVKVFDASAILAYLQDEKGQDVAETALDAGSCWVTTVNYCEVLTRLYKIGMPADEAKRDVHNLGLTVVDFDRELAEIAASLQVRTSTIGASLGDRACLALAERAGLTHHNATVYTAEQSWAKLKWPFKMIVIR